MDRFIGLDAHASSCTLGVVGPSGKRLGSHVVETNARALIEVRRGIPRNRHVCLEEGTLSGWLHEVLEPHVEELVVTGVRKEPRPEERGHRREALVGTHSDWPSNSGSVPSRRECTRDEASSGDWAI